MSRELWLLRHGKAERYDGSEDYGRVLKKRGERDVKLMANWLKKCELFPEAIISSSATRAMMSANIVCNTLGVDIQQIRPEKRLYDEGLVRVKSVLADCPLDFGKIIVIGHNPELEEVLIYLVDKPGLLQAEKLLPTAALARLLLPDDWSQLEKGCAQLLSITTPKSLASEG